MNTFSMKQHGEAREVLAQNGIKYTYRVVNLLSPGFFSSERSGHVTNAGINSDFTRQYYLYVNKKDYENAKYLINKTRENYR